MYVNNLAPKVHTDLPLLIRWACVAAWRISAMSWNAWRMDSGVQSSLGPSHVKPVLRLGYSQTAVEVSNPSARNQLHMDTSVVYQLQVHSFALEHLSSSLGSSTFCTDQSRSSSSGILSPLGCQIWTQFDWLPLCEHGWQYTPSLQLSTAFFLASVE